MPYFVLPFIFPCSDHWLFPFNWHIYYLPYEKKKFPFNPRYLQYPRICLLCTPTASAKLKIQHNLYVRGREGIIPGFL